MRAFFAARRASLELVGSGAGAATGAEDEAEDEAEAEEDDEEDDDEEDDDKAAAAAVGGEARLDIVLHRQPHIPYPNKA